MKEITYEIKEETAKRWKAILREHFAEKHKDNPRLAEVYRSLDLSSLLRYAAFDYVAQILSSDAEVAMTAMEEAK